MASSDVDLKAAETQAKAAEATEAQIKAQEIPILREKLRGDYETLLSDANPHLNYITTKLTKHKSGFALWGVHAYFTRYTFSIGNDAKVVTAWMDQNRSELRRAGIVRVGVRSSEGWGGWCFFDL